MYFFILVAFYFVVMCLLAWLALFPAGRQLVASKYAQVLKKTAAMQRTVGSGFVANVVQLFRYAVSGVAYVVSKVRRYYLLLLLCFCLLALPVLLSIALGHKHVLDGFQELAYEENAQIASVLQGEQLVAPLPLPPDVFTTSEVLLVRPMIVNASRNWDLLDVAFKQKLLTVFKIMKEQHGYEMTMLEGYRSPQRQEMLAKRGKSVTNAKAFQSYHQYGKAADCAFYRNGKLVISERDPWAMQGYALYGKVAKSVGLTWGGDWRMMDFGHTELRNK